VQTRNVLCTFVDDGVDSIPFRWHQNWSTSSGVRSVVATRLRTNYVAAGEGNLGVISTYQVPTPRDPDQRIAGDHGGDGASAVAPLSFLHLCKATCALKKIRLGPSKCLMTRSMASRRSERSRIPDQRTASAEAFVVAQVWIKKAAALTHKETGRLEARLADAIVAAADEALAGKHDDQFVVEPYQAGAGTSHQHGRQRSAREPCE
jgi:hypothetical protein